RRPRASSSAPIAAEESPLPRPDSTPPVTKMNFLGRAFMGNSFGKLTDPRRAVAVESVADADRMDGHEWLRQPRGREIPGRERLARRGGRGDGERARFETQVDGLHAPPVGVRDHL